MESVRSLDVAESATTDLLALNNEVVKLRSLVHKVKVDIIHGITRRIRALKSKRGPEEHVAKNQKKAQNLIEEIHLIKVLDKDSVIKYAFGCTKKFEKIVTQPDLPLKTKALARMSEHQLLKEKIEKFRKAHTDWKSLVEYLLTKNTNREYKKNKTQKTPGAAKKPSEAVETRKKRSAKTLTNIEAKDLLVKTYLENKLGEEKLFKGEKSRRKRLQVDCSSDNEENVICEKRVRQENVQQTEENAKQNQKQSNKIMTNKDSRGEQGKSVEVLADEDSDSSSEESDSQSDSRSEDLSEFSDQEPSGTKTDNVDNAKDKRDGRTSNESKSQRGQKDRPKLINREAVVVKKINLEELDSDEVPLDKSAVVPALLLPQMDQEQKQGSIVKDSFFAGSDEEDGDGDFEGYSDNKDIEDDGAEKESRRGLSNKTDRERGKKAFQSTFIESLRKKENVAFIQNEDWKRIRQEGRDHKLFGSRSSDRGSFSRGRGEGRGKFSRGRGEGRGSFSRGRGEGHGSSSRGRGEGRGSSSRGRGEGRGSFSRGRGEGRGSSSRGRGEGQHGTGRKSFNNKSVAAVKTRTTGPEGPVHPSWEARKKQKLEESKIAEFKGKRITFDD